jgi:hypothetical protein
MSTSGPWKPFDAVPLHELIFKFSADSHIALKQNRPEIFSFDIAADLRRLRVGRHKERSIALHVTTEHIK